MVLFPFLLQNLHLMMLLELKVAQFWIGCKMACFGDMLSVSAAFLSEEEEIVGKNSIYLFADYGDS
ncbi:MAG: hypothetical protein CM1200mP13_16100 [Candidatus Pelagibacterales bacterium]|nr:MAG: hypothetical protein CM1200mP13_16100 [Pelagibacterales bacterium]